MSKIRKAFVVSIMTMTVLSMSVVVAPQVEAASPGDLITIDGMSAVYYLGADGKRYVFPNESTYFSWYGDFSTVTTITQSELESYPLGSNVTMRPGTKLVQEVSMETPWTVVSSKVFAVEPNGELTQLPDAATAVALYGAGWEGMITGIPSAYFTSYNDDSKVASDSAYPAGSLVKFGEDPTVYWIGADAKAYPFADEAAFTANRFKWADVINSALTLPTTGDPITGAIAAITDTSSGAGGHAGAGTGLTVSLASGTAAAGNIPQGSLADFVTVNLTASNDGPVVVNTLTVSLFDLGDYGNVDSVAAYEDGIRLSTSKDMTSDRDVSLSFSGGLTVAKGTTRTLVIRAEVTSTSGNYSLGVNSASDVATNGAVVSGSFPIVGNPKAVASVETGGIVVTGFTASAETAEIGEDDILLADFMLEANSLGGDGNEDIIWESVRIENKDDDIASNIKIYVDGDEITDGVINGDYVQFDMGNLLIEDGDSVDVEIRGDIGVTDSNDTYNLRVDEADDFGFVGQDFGFGIVPTGAGLTATGIALTLEAGEVSIDMDKTAQDTSVRADTDNVVLATLVVTSNGENATLNEIASGTLSTGFAIEGLSGTFAEAMLENIELRDTDGGIYSLESNYFAGSDYWSLFLDEEILLPMGVEKTFEVLADIDSTMTNENKLRVVLNDDALDIEGDVSDATLDNIKPSSVEGDTVEIENASLKWTTMALTNDSAVEGSDGILLFHATVEAGDSSLVELRSVKLVDNSAHNAFNDDNITDLRLELNGLELDTLSGRIQGDGETGANITFSQLDSDNRVIEAGMEYDLKLYADLESSVVAASSTILRLGAVANVDADDVDGDTVTDVTANHDQDCRTISFTTTGSLKVQMKTDDQKANDDVYQVAGTETEADRYMGELVFTTQYEAIELETLELTNSATGNATGYSTARGDDLAYVHLYDEDGVEVAMTTIETLGDVVFEADDFVSEKNIFEADKATSLFIGVTAKPIDDEHPFGTADYLSDLQFYISDVEASGDTSKDDISMAAAASPIFGQFTNSASESATTTIVGAALTNIAAQELDDDQLTGGTTIIGEYTFTFDNGENATSSGDIEAELTTLLLTTASSSGLLLTDIQAYIEGDSGNKTTAGVHGGAGKATINLTQLDGDTNLVDGSVTLVIEATVGGTTASGWLQTKIADLSTDFTYNGNNGIGTDITGVRLNIDSVTGDKLTD